MTILASVLKKQMPRLEAIRIYKSWLLHEVDRMSAFIKKEFEPNYDPIIRISSSSWRKWARGGLHNGKPYANFNIDNDDVIAVITCRPVKLVEYDSYKNDPDIGQLLNVSWKREASAVVAHELAHSIQHYSNFNMIKHKLGIADLKYELHHGKYFREIYRALRVPLVNEFNVENESFNIVEDEVVNSPKAKKSGLTVAVSKRPDGWFEHQYIDAVSNEHLFTLYSSPGQPVKFLNQSIGEIQWLYDDFDNKVIGQIKAKRIMLERARQVGLVL